MAKVFLLLFVVVIADSFEAAAAAPPANLVKVFNLPQAGAAHAVAKDSEGNIYVGTGPRAGLFKFDAQGTLVWSFGLPVGDQAGIFEVKGIEIDANDDIYFVATVQGTVTLPGFEHQSFVPSSLYFAKMSPDKELFFSKVARNLYPGNHCLAKGPAGSFLMSGSFSSATIFTYENISLSTTYSDSVILRLNPDGSPIWTKKTSGAGNEHVDALGSSAAGSIFVGGSTAGSPQVGLGGGIANSGSSTKSLYLFKLDSDGSASWSKTVQSDYEQGNFFTESGAGFFSEALQAYIWAGDFTGTQTLAGKSISSSAQKDVFVARFNSEGEASWVTTFSGGQDQFVSSVVADGTGSIYVAGFFQSDIHIGNDVLASDGAEDMFLAKLRADGSVGWSKRFGYVGRDRYPVLRLTQEGDLLVVGGVEGGLRVDGKFYEGLHSSDAFLMRILGRSVPLSFTSEISDKVLSAGMNLVLHAEIAGPSPVTYQWWFNGAALANQTNSALVITNFAATNAGGYSVVVRDADSTLQSRTALVSFTDASSIILNIHPSLTIFGTIGKTYRIEYATEPRSSPNWINAGNVTLTNSPQLWVDSEETGAKHRRFYRVTLIQE